MDIKIDYVQRGWQCPICKRVYSPTTMMCFYCGENMKTTSTTVEHEKELGEAIALDNAIADINKLDKIEQIVQSWNDMNSFDSMIQIKEVLDGIK